MAESCHFYDGVHHAQLKPYVLWKKHTCFTEDLYQDRTQKWKENEWTKFDLKDLRKRMKEKLSGGKRWSY